MQQFRDKPKFRRSTRAKGSSRPERRLFPNLVQSKWGGAGRHFAVLKAPKLAVKADALPFGALKVGQLKVRLLGLHMNRTDDFAFVNRVLLLCCCRMSVLDGCDVEIGLIKAFVAGGKL
jgi:hypothetical protein